ncbi:MAG: serine/threonine protein kinase, partial [Chloroflexaceae bacterium]|nr:serine/threonine protein kinase [Chloroflexaceae bacterium]
MTQLQPGMELIGRYTIQQVIGAGGFGTVYRATDTLDERDVAVKSLALDALPTANHTQVQLNFKREAKLLYTLSHPTLPRVSNYFIETNDAYLVMDYIAGQNLADLLDSSPGRPFDAATAIAVILPVLDALAYLHTHDPPIIHRDIKPGNIILTPQQTVYLVDFGLAKLDQGVRHTVATAGYASAGFSSPELYIRQVDPRADLYSVGATLYALLTGQVPPSATERNACHSIGVPEPLLPIQQVNPAVSDELAAVVMRLLALRPDDRYPTATAVREALQGRRKVAVATEPAVPPAAEQARQREAEAARQRA